MKKTFCDFCGQEIKKPEVKVTMNELEYDACVKCTNRMARIVLFQEWGILAEPDKDDPKTEDKPEEKAAGDFWATHDPSGGDLPPEDDENDEKSVGGGYEVDPRKDKNSGTAAGQETKKSRKCGSRKNLRIAEGRLVSEGDLRGDAHFSGDRVQPPEDGEGQ